LEDNASILNNEESVSSNTTCSTITKNFEFQLISQQRDILQYQLTAVKIFFIYYLINICLLFFQYVQLLTQYILLQRETNSLLADDQSAQQLFVKFFFNKKNIEIIFFFFDRKI